MYSYRNFRVLGTSATEAEQVVSDEETTVINGNIKPQMNPIVHCSIESVQISM